MMSLSPPGQIQWTVEGVEPSSAGCKPTVFPLDDTPISKSSGPGGDRTHIPLFKRQVLRRLSYKAIQCVGQELNLHSECGWVTATWARQCPADTSMENKRLTTDIADDTDKKSGDNSFAHLIGAL